MNRVIKYYNQNPDKEWQRLQSSAYNSIESIITKKYLEKFLKPKSTVADIGCGPGFYSTWLLENGHDVLLSDLSENLLVLAKNKIQEIKSTGKIIDIVKSDASDLSQITSDQFDLTILFGPIYHILDEKKRIAAIQEAKRITKPGGHIFVSAINRLCPLLAMLHKSPENFVIELTDDIEELQRILNTGCYENFEETENAFTDAYFVNTDEIPNIFINEGIDLIDCFGCEGIASYINDKANIIQKNPEAWQKFIEIIYQKSNDPNLLGMSEHVVYVGQKPKLALNYPYKFTNDLLVPIEENHAHVLFPHIYKTKICDTIMWDGPTDIESFVSNYKQRQLQVMKFELYQFTIMSDGIPCGTCSLSPDDDKFTADIGLWISQSKSGQGLGTQVIRELIKFGFNFLNLQRIEAYIFEGNIVSRRLFEKNNFIHEGTLRNACLKRGNLVNEWLFAITKDDFEKIRFC